jgi:SAM-dependent methyltransferase
MLELAALEAGARSLVDVGCGPGFYALRGKRAGLFTCAVDAVSEMLDGVRSRVDVALMADLEALSLERTYDRVICAGVLDFVASPDVAMSHLASLVEPGGRLVLLVPLHGRGALFYRLEKTLVGLQVNLFDADWLIEHAARHGLKFVESRRPLPWNGAFLFVRATDRPV